jgi:hypothetical protein
MDVEDVLIAFGLCASIFGAFCIITGQTLATLPVVAAEEGLVTAVLATAAKRAKRAYA